MHFCLYHPDFVFPGDIQLLLWMGAQRLILFHLRKMPLGSIQIQVYSEHSDTPDYGYRCDSEHDSG